MKGAGSEVNRSTVMPGAGRLTRHVRIYVSFPLLSFLSSSISSFSFAFLREKVYVIMSDLSDLFSGRWLIAKRLIGIPGRRSGDAETGGQAGPRADLC